MRDLKISTATSRFATKWTNQTIMWDSLVDRLGQTTTTPETPAQYAAMSKAEQGAVKDLGGFVGGHLAGGRRKKGNVLARSLVCLDIDHATEDVWLTLAETVNWTAVCYTTHSHTPEAPRARLVLPLTRDVTEEEYAPVARAVAAAVGIDLFDDTTFEAQRLMYWPSTPTGGEYVANVYEGPWLDPDQVLATYPDWHDATTWPVSSRQTAAALTSHGPKQADPRTKTGVIGAFCNAYTITEALEDLIPGVYTPTADPNRWTYAAGETTGGAIIYDGDTFLYSHHGTDPAGGQTLNAFDLVRIHKYGDLDDRAKPDTPGHQLPSYQAMTEYATGLEPVKQILAEEMAAQVKEAFKPLTSGEGNHPENPDSWAGQLTFTRKGALEATLSNLMTIMGHDPDLAGIAYDQLANAIAVTRELPWPRPAVHWRDTDDDYLNVYLEAKYTKFSEADRDTALAVTADRRAFHPVINYLNSLPAWDGVRRVDTLLVDYLGATDDHYTRSTTRKEMVAAVRRVKTPGCKFDTMLVLAGPQGVGKSTLVARLATPWFTDSLSLADTRDKTAAEKIQGAWVIEIGEMAGMRKAETEALRAFISRQDDQYREAYGRRVKSHPRQCVFFGTTNAENGFLPDPAGNRRFWPINCPGTPDGGLKPWHLDQATVDQIWAEAVALEAAGEPLHLDAAMEAEARERQRMAIEVDERLGIIAEYLDTMLPEDWEARDLYSRLSWLGDPGQTGALARTRVSIIEVWCEALGKNRADLTRRDSYWIANGLKRLGWTNDERNQARIPIYGKQKLYTRMGTEGQK